MNRFLCIFALLSVSSYAQNWQEILSPSQGTIPPTPAENVVWRTDFYASLEEAQKSGRPILVTWRCLPCKQCATFDKDVLEGGTELTPLLKQFVTVRMTDAGQLDERYFPFRGYQDLDLSWWGYFLSPEGKLYGVYGGKDHLSDATRISTASFAKTMQRILAHHYDPRLPSWAAIDGTTPDTTQLKHTPRDFDTASNFIGSRPHLQKQECIHCHQVNDLIHFDAQKKGTFDLKQYTQSWPLPENVGIHLDRDDGLFVTKVEPNSPAEKAGLKVGDRLGMASNRKLHSQADFRGALHRAGYDATSIDIAWTRDDEGKLGTLETKANWREGENYWRKSVYEGIIGPHLGFFPLPGPNQGKGKLSIRPYMGQGEHRKTNKWNDTGLQPNMEIVEINGRSDNWEARQLIAWFRLNHKPGDHITLKTKAGKTFTRVVEDEATE